MDLSRVFDTEGWVQILRSAEHEEPTEQDCQLVSEALMKLASESSSSAPESDSDSVSSQEITPTSPVVPEAAPAMPSKKHESRRQRWCGTEICKFCKDYDEGGSLRQACRLRPKELKRTRRFHKKRTQPRQSIRLINLSP
jgi:hypothetical protein